MDPLVLIGLFFGGGLVFIAIFIVIMAKFGKGDGNNPKMPEHQSELPSQRDIGGF